MPRGRLVVLVSFAVVALGVLAGLLALVLDPARAAVGPLPGEGLALPADTRFLAGVDVKRLTASPLYRKYGWDSSRVESLNELVEATGLRPERDLDQVVVAGRSGIADGVVLVLGRFDVSRLGATLESRGAAPRTVQEGALYVLDANGPRPRAIALPADGVLVAGAVAAVETVIANQSANGPASLAANETLLGLLRRVKPGATFWIVGDRSLLAGLPAELPVPGSGTVRIPPLKSVVATGDLEPVISPAATADAGDAAAARSLSDLLQGLIALAALQAARDPVLKELASGVSVTTEEATVHVHARVPYELLESLRRRGPAAERRE